MEELRTLMDNAPYISEENVVTHPEHYDDLCSLAEVCESDERITGLWYIEGETVDDSTFPCLIIRSSVPDEDKERGQVEKLLYHCCDCDILFDYDDVVSPHPRGEKLIVDYEDYLRRTLRPDAVFTVYNKG